MAARLPQTSPPDGLRTQLSEPREPPAARAKWGVGREEAGGGGAPSRHVTLQGAKAKKEAGTGGLGNGS